MSTSNKNVPMNGDTGDIFERYVMPYPILVSAKSEMIFSNYDEITKKINRSPQLLKSYLQKTYGGLWYFKDKKFYTKCDINSDDLYKKIVSFNKRYIFCGKCEKPDTILCSDSIHINCLACGITNGNTMINTKSISLNPIRKKINTPLIDNIINNKTLEINNNINNNNNCDDNNSDDIDIDNI